MRDLTALASKAASQHGLLTTQQLRAAGIGRRRTTTLIEAGLLVPSRRGVLRLAGADPTWEQRLLVVCLAPGPTTVASHRAAMRLWKLRSVDDELEVTVRHPAQRRVPGLIVHRSRDLEPGDITWVDGVPTTNPIRTICDAGLIFPTHEVARIVRHAIATDLVRRNDLRRFRRRVGRQGRSGVGPLQAALDSLPSGAEAGESGPEIALLGLVERSALPEPVVQLPVVAGGRAYRVDLAYPEHRLAIEYDGVAAHANADRFVDDRRRQNDLVCAGWTVLRFTAADLRSRPEAIVAQIRRNLQPDRFCDT